MSVAQAPTRPQPSQPNESWINLMFFGAIAGVAVSIAIVVAPVVVAMALVFLIVKTTGIKWWWIALGAVAAYAILQGVGQAPLEAIEQVFRKANRIAQHKGFGKAVSRIWNHKEIWWSKTLPGLPLGAFVGAVAATLFDSGYPIFDPRAEVQKQKAIELGRQAAAKKTPKAPEVAKGLAVLGPYAYGDLPVPWVQRHRGFPYLCMHPVLLGRHVVIVGKPGSGKTTSLLQLAYLAAKVYGWRVYFLDGKGDATTMREFTSLMLAAGVPPGEIGAFPVRPFDGWRTSGDFQQGYSQLLNRLMGALTFSEPYYRDTTRLYLSRALKVDKALPRSSSELLERLAGLVDQAPADQKQEARGAHNRYESLFDSFPGQLDGGWSFDDHSAGYVLLKGLSNRDEAQNLAGYIFECFKQFATDMKDESDKVLLIVDEFPAVMGDSDTAGMTERLRSFGCGVALSGQNYEGLGEDRARIIEAAGTLILHRLSDSDDLARLAGTVQEFAVTTQVDFNDGSTGRGTVTPEHRFKAEPNVIGRQRDGEITLITDRSVGHGFVTRVNPDGQWAAATNLLSGREAANGAARRGRPEEPEPPDVVELR